LFDIAIQEAIFDQEAKGCFVVNTTTELIPNNESLIQVIADNKRDFENLFYKYLKKGKDKEQLKTNQDLWSLASLLFALCNGIKVVSKINLEKQKLKSSIDLALTLVC